MQRDLQDARSQHALINTELAQAQKRLEALRKEKRSVAQAAEEAKAQRASAAAETRRLSAEIEALKTELAKSRAIPDHGEQKGDESVTAAPNPPETDGQQAPAAHADATVGESDTDLRLAQANERAVAAEQRAEARDRDVEQLRKELEAAREDARQASAKAKVAQDAKSAGGPVKAGAGDAQAMRVKLQESMKVRARLREAKQQAEKNLKELQQRFDELSRATEAK